MNRGRLSLIIFTATIGIALLSFIAVPLGVVGFGVFALGLFIYAERQRRGFWEQAASMKFKTLKERLDILSGRVDGHHGDIKDLKNSREEKTMVRQSKMAQKPMVKSSSKPSPKTLEAPPLPRALKAGMSAKKVQTPKTAKPEKEGAYDFISDAVVKALINKALEHGRVEVFVQPIMRLPQRQTRFYELFARIRAKPGLYIPAARYMKIAEQDNAQHSIDSLLLLHSLKTIEESGHIEKAAPFFLNITSATLRNGAFMKRLLAFLSRNRHLAPRLIFEICQRDFLDLQPQSLEIVKGLGALGCSFSLDHIEILEFDVAALMRLKVRFVKMDARRLLSNPQDARTFNHSKSRLEGNGIGVIIEKIETESDMRALLDFDVHYGQGYLFGKPDLQGAYKDQTRVKRAL